MIKEPSSKTPLNTTIYSSSMDQPRQITLSKDGWSYAMTISQDLTAEQLQSIARLDWEELEL